MIHPLLRSFSASLFAWWLYLVLSPTQTGGAPSEHVRQPADDPITRQEQDREETVLYFPDYVDGGEWSVQLVLSNVDPDAAAEVRVDVYDPDGQSVRDLFDSDLTLVIPSLGSRVWKSAGVGAIRRGWIEVQADSPSVSGLLTYRHTQSGIEVSAQPVELGNQFALFVEESTSVGAGVAVFKLDASPRLKLRTRDEEGNDPLEGGFVPWADFYQAARTLPQWFSVQGVDSGFLEDFRGLLFLETEDESGFAPLGLRFGKETSSLSAVPAIRAESQAPRETALIFPDYVDGGGWSVQLVLSNVGLDAAADVRVDVYDPDGQPVRDLFDSESTLEIPALGTRVVRSAGTGTIRRGWIEVRTETAAVTGLLTYRYNETGIEVSVEPVPLGRDFALFVEESETIGAGLALFNPDVESRIELRLRDEEGNDPLDGVFLPWGDFNHAARTLPEWFDVPGVDAGFLADFRGLLFLRSEEESGFAALGLRFGKGTSSLSAVPAIRILDGGENIGRPTTSAIPPIVMEVGSRVSFDLSAYFEVPDGNALSYSAQWPAFAAGAPLTVTGALIDSMATIWAVGDGEADIAFTAADASLNVSQNVRVTTTRPAVPTGTPSLRVIYAIPSDKEWRQQYSSAIQEAIEAIQAWYLHQLDGHTFAIDATVPEVCHLAKPEAWFKEYPVNDWRNNAWARLREALRTCAPVDEGFDRDNIWLVYADILEECDPEHGTALGRGWNGITMIGGQDLRALTDSTYVVGPHCYGGSFGRWFGGLAHELGHGFNLLHPPGCDDGLPTCDRRAVMYGGLYSWPDTHLRAEDEIPHLLANPFIRKP